MGRDATLEPSWVRHLSGTVASIPGAVPGSPTRARSVTVRDLVSLLQSLDD